MIFHENRLLGWPYLIFFRKLRTISKKVSSAAVVIGALRVNIPTDKQGQRVSTKIKPLLNNLSVK